MKIKGGSHFFKTSNKFQGTSARVDQRAGFTSLGALANDSAWGHWQTVICVCVLGRGRIPVAAYTPSLSPSRQSRTQPRAPGKGRGGWEALKGIPAVTRMPVPSSVKYAVFGTRAAARRAGRLAGCRAPSRRRTLLSRVTEPDNPGSKPKQRPTH